MSRGERGVKMRDISAPIREREFGAALRTRNRRVVELVREASVSGPPTRLPIGVESLLLEAQAHELDQSVLSRRIAYRTTRIVIGAVLEAGYSASAVAGVLGVTPESVRRRIERDGHLSANVVAELTRMSPDALADRASRHGVSLRSEPRADTDTLVMLEVVRLLAIG